MDLKYIKELMLEMEKTETKRLSIKKDDFELQLEREGQPMRLADPLPAYEEQKAEKLQQRADAAFSKGGHASTPPQKVPAHEGPSLAEEPEKQDGVLVKSPMVGTYYASPGPGESVFVKVGDSVSEDTVLCIVEAMKVMNEIKAGVSGTLSEILVENGVPVEFGTPLFRVS